MPQKYILDILFIAEIPIFVSKKSSRARTKFLFGKKTTDLCRPRRYIVTLLQQSSINQKKSFRFVALKKISKIVCFTIIGLEKNIENHSF